MSEIAMRKFGVSTVSKVCTFCVHFDDKNPGAKVCSAFPEGIPLEIWKGENTHTENYSGDQGINFKKIDFKQTA